MADLQQPKTDKGFCAREIANMLIKSYESIKPVCCPLEKFFKKSFVDRVLYLSDQPAEDLQKMLERCKACNQCENFKKK